MNRPTHPRCIVGPETARMLDLGHPWVLADRYTRKWPKADSGDLIALVDETGRSLGTALYEHGARIVARRLDERAVALDRRWLTERFRQALEIRRWIDFGDTTVSRLVNAEGDHLPGLTVDRYADYLQVQYFTSAWEPYLGTVAEALQEVCAPQGIYVKHRPREARRLATRGKASGQFGRLLAGAAAPADLAVRENGLSYRVDLVRDMHTGLFHDQRRNRLNFRGVSAGAEVLNLFAYTGAFSVAAAAGGAARVTSIDASARYLGWAEENFRLNGIDPRAHEFLVGDCSAELDRLAGTGDSFDIVLMDPPSFSTTRKSRFTTTGGTAELVEKSLRLLPSGGLLVASSNLQKMTLAEYLKELRRGSLAAGRQLQVIEVGGQAEDFPFPVTFPEGQYLKYVVCAVR